jgi:hypothetical protein
MRRPRRVREAAFMTKTFGWAALGWTVALNAVWAAAMTAATLFLVVLGGLAGSTAGAVSALAAYDLLTGVNLLTVLA